MRLWHKNMITALPRKQLLSQWRECCAIASNISTKGTPNHMLVNKVLNFNMSHFYTYGLTIAVELRNRGYKCDFEKFAKYFTYPHETKIVSMCDLFLEWHNARYFKQCYYNLQEKYDCGGITKEEWEKLEEVKYEFARTNNVQV